MLKDQHIMNLKEMNKFGDRNVNAIRKMPTHHIILIAQNDIGRYNLYQLITASHMTYYARRPRIPKSLINEHREGIIIGSACEAGELYRAVLEKQSAQQIARLADFYDYYEIQPIGNDMFMLEDEKTPNINTEEDLRNVNREIVELGEKFGKPVVATCDVHFLDPEDEVYRRIIMAGKGFKDADQQAPLYLHGRVCISWFCEGERSCYRKSTEDRTYGRENLTGKPKQVSSGNRGFRSGASRYLLS